MAESTTDEKNNNCYHAIEAPYAREETLKGTSGFGDKKHLLETQTSSIKEPEKR